MSPFLINLVGVVAAVLTTGAWLPQLLKTWRTGRAEDFSWVYLTMFTSGVALWAIYGICRRDVAVIGANIVTVALVLTVVCIKLRQR